MIAKKLSILSVVIAVFVVAPFAGTASAAPELRIAYVDLQKALAESKAGKKAQKSYEQEVKQAQAKIDKKKDEFEKLRASFQSQRDSLNKEALAEKEEKLLAMEKDIKRSFTDSQETLRRKNAQIVNELVKDVRKVVDEVGKAKNFTFILEKNAQAVLYTDSSLDITDEVVAKFNSIRND